MKLAVFDNASYGSQQLIRHALEVGYTVSALSRYPEQISIRHPSLAVIKGDTASVVDVEKTIQYTNAVLAMFSDSEVSLEQKLDTIIHRMSVHNLRRIVVSFTATSAGHKQNRDDSLASLQNAKLDWTIVHTYTDAHAAKAHTSARQTAMSLLHQLFDASCIHKSIMQSTTYGAGKSPGPQNSGTTLATAIN